MQCTSYGRAVSVVMQLSRDTKTREFNRARQVHRKGKYGNVPRA